MLDEALEHGEARLVELGVGAHVEVDGAVDEVGEGDGSRRGRARRARTQDEEGRMTLTFLDLSLPDADSPKRGLLRDEKKGPPY